MASLAASPSELFFTTLVHHYTHASFHVDNVFKSILGKEVTRPWATMTVGAEHKNRFSFVSTEFGKSVLQFINGNVDGVFKCAEVWLCCSVKFTFRTHIKKDDVGLAGNELANPFRGNIGMLDARLSHKVHVAMRTCAGCGVFLVVAGISAGDTNKGISLFGLCESG